MKISDYKIYALKVQLVQNTFENLNSSEMTLKMLKMMQIYQNAFFWGFHCFFAIFGFFWKFIKKQGKKLGSNNTVDGVMVHPSDGEATKHFNSVHPHFLAKSRNVRLRLCTNRFNLFRSFVAPYYYCPVILMVYNLPMEMCMRLEFMFLSTIILGPNSSGQNIDVCLWPLIDELTQLWSSGALTYVSRKHNFFMRVALMWTINDFLTYGMVSGWSM